MAWPSAREWNDTSGLLFLDAKEMRFEERVSAVLREWLSEFRRAGKSGDLEIKTGGQNKIRRRSDSLLLCAPLRGDGDLERTTGESAVGWGFLVVGRRGGIAIRMVAAFHVCHEPGVIVADEIILGRRCGGGYLGVRERRLGAAHEAGQDSEPQRNRGGQCRF